MNLADVRANYLRGQLRRADLVADPIEQFRRWMDESVAAGVVEPTAMSLATTGADGIPRVRTVLLKGLNEAGFAFYTNFDSRKGRALAQNPAASLLFPWLALERQVLVTGRVERATDAEAAVYFASRPRESQLAAWTSGQSQPVETRETLEAELSRVRERFGAETGDVPLPPFWAATGSAPRRSSSGKAAPIGCTTDSSMCETRSSAGRCNAWRPEDKCRRQKAEGEVSLQR